MKSAKEMVAQANSRVKTVSAQQAMSLLKDSDTVFVDLRDKLRITARGQDSGFGACKPRHAGVRIGSSASLSQSCIFFGEKDFILLRERWPLCAGSGYGAEHGTGTCLPPRGRVQRMEGS